MTHETPVQETKSDTIEVDDLNKFVQVLSTWHEREVADLKQMLEMPDGVKVQFSAEPGSEVFMVLEGETRKAFILGIHTALMKLGKLPFKVEFDEPEANENDQG